MTVQITENIENPDEIKAKVIYTKTQQARYIAHLDNIDVMCKALRRIQLPYAVSQGCHPRPKLSFASPLPLGHASYCEYFVVTLTKAIDPEWLKEALTKELPNGMEVIEVITPYHDKRTKNKGDCVKYRLTFDNEDICNKAFDFLINPETTFEIESKGRNRTYKLGSAVKKPTMYHENNQFFITADFIQGIAEVPSVSKIITALARFLGENKDSLKLIERLSLQAL